MLLAFDEIEDALGLRLDIGLFEIVQAGKDVGRLCDGAEIDDALCVHRGPIGSQAGSLRKVNKQQSEYESDRAAEQSDTLDRPVPIDSRLSLSILGRADGTVHGWTAAEVNLNSCTSR